MWNECINTNADGFNKRLFSLMAAKHISIKELAIQSENSYKTIYNLLYGKRIPRVDTVQRVCKVLHTKIDYLYPVE